MRPQSLCQGQPGKSNSKTLPRVLALRKFKKMSMMTFEVNILCANTDAEDPKACSGIVTGEPMDRIEEAIESAEDEARRNDWVWIRQWYCPDCAEKKTA